MIGRPHIYLQVFQFSNLSHGNFWQGLWFRFQILMGSRVDFLREIGMQTTIFSSKSAVKYPETNTKTYKTTAENPRRLFCIVKVIAFLRIMGMGTYWMKVFQIKESNKTPCPDEEVYSQPAVLMQNQRQTYTFLRVYSDWSSLQPHMLIFRVELLALC